MRDDGLTAAYERLHEDFLYLEKQYRILMEQKEQAVRELHETKAKLWRMQLENERCKAEIGRLRKNEMQSE